MPICVLELRADLGSNAQDRLYDLAPKSLEYLKAAKHFILKELKRLSALNGAMWEVASYSCEQFRYISVFKSGESSFELPLASGLYR
jgi:hypothetical protein